MKDYSEKLVSFSQVSPTIFIGLGGSGSDVVNRIAAKLKSRWNWHTLDQLIHFFALDTNTHDLSNQEHVPRDNRILISDFDKRSFIEQKRGSGHEKEDSFVTQWVHDWYQFRGTRGAGAGQIRIESRLSMYYQLEQDRGKIIQRLNKAMNTARHHDNPYRKNNPPHFNVFIYGSVAGGTGSGSFLSVAYLMKELITAQGWIPKVFGTLIMPSLFLNDVPGALHPDINANGYAALKELEHLMKLGAEGSVTEEAFHYNPQLAHQPNVTDKPFDFVYIADKPTMFEIDAYKNAIADAAYLLLYSPILGAQASDYDNYEKHQKGLISGYTVYYGSNGCSVLILPDQDILEYCAMRYAAKAMGDYLLFKTGDDGADFEINFNDPKFQRLSKQAQAEEIDQKFVSFVEYMARREVEDEIANGPYQAVSKLQTPTGSNLLQEFNNLVDTFGQEVAESLSLHTLTTTDILPSNIKVDSEVNDLRNELNESRAKIRGIWDAARQDIKSGRVIRDFFQRHQSNPYQQRLFLVRAKDRLREQIEELNGRIDTTRSAIDLSGDEVSSKMKDWRERLNETAEWTMMERIKRKNEDFEFTRSGFVEYFNGELVEGNRILTVSEFKRDYIREALEHFEHRLDAFRTVASQAAESISEIHKECEDARVSGRFAHGEGQSNAYILDVEALDEVGGERLWNYYFEDRFVADGRELNYFDEQAIFGVITDAFNPKQDEQGRRVTKSSKEITDEIKAGLTTLGRERLAPEIVGTRSGGTDMSEKGLRLDDALLYEARYHFKRQFAEDGSNAEPTQEQINGYIKSKIRFCDNKSAPLATFHESEDSRVINSEASLVGVHDAYKDVLGPCVDEVLPHAQSIPNWFDEKTMVFYHANLGIPLFYYKRVNGEMMANYQRLMEKPPAERGYPLHIDANWEDALANLDPNQTRAEERKNEERDSRLGFAVGFALGVFREEPDGRVFWHVGTFDDELGPNRFRAFKALSKLDERTRRRIDAKLTEARRAIDRGEDPSLVQRLRDYLAELDEVIWALEQKKDASQAALLDFVKREEELLKDWLG